MLEIGLRKSISAPGEEYLKFYADRAGEPTASKLPDALSSRRFWDNASTSAVSIVHFAGVNCHLADERWKKDEKR